MAQTKKPNTICRNPNCTHGEDGGRKKFYACLSCLKRESWRAYCCCVECYDEYTRIILDSRSKGKTEPAYPERTDMTSDDIQKVMETPAEQVEKYTKEVELKEYFEENPDAALSEIIEKVNKDIDENAKAVQTEAELPDVHKPKKRRKNINAE